MGVFIKISIDPHAIDPDDWAAAYDETALMLEAWQPPLLGQGIWYFEDVRVIILSRSIREPAEDPRDETWMVVGDRETLQYFEGHRIRRNLLRYRHTPAVGRDLALVLAEADGFWVPNVIDNKTQGYPYHYAVLAAGMVFEDRFPGHVIVFGDIDRRQADEARKMARGILGRDLSLPVLVDAPSLLERLRAGYGEEELAATFWRTYLGEDWPYEDVLRALPGDAGVREWLRLLHKQKSPEGSGAPELIVAWLNARGDLASACRLACLDPRGPRWDPEAFVDVLASVWDVSPQQPRRTPDFAFDPKVQSNPLASDMASLLLYREARRRNRRVDAPLAEMEAGLTEAFGERGAALGTRLAEASRKPDEDERSREAMQFFVDLALRAPESEQEALERLVLAECTAERLTETQRSWVLALAWQVTKQVEQLRDDPVLDDVTGVRRALVRRLSRRVRLTEDAWDVIMSEEDVEMLRWWLALALLDADEMRAHLVRRALFENAVLRAYAMDPGRDRSDMLGLATLVHQFERRLERTLTTAERVRIDERLTRLGPDRLAEVVLDFSPKAMRDWLTNAGAR